MSKAKEFEQQISRIYEVLSSETAEVTWNDKIPDPDNPKQLRQIDITLKRYDEITHIECRSHKSPQDTKWIEELYGRKISLKAKAIIAVSNSGFTKGAVLKANKLGVFLRSLNNLSKQEILSWGRTTAISIHYYVLNNISFRFTFKNMNNVTAQGVAGELIKKPEYINALFNNMKYRFNQQRDFYFPYCFRLEMEAYNMKLCDTPVHGASVQGEVDELVYKTKCPSIFEFRSNDKENNRPIAKVERSENIKAEIITANNGLASIHFDLSSSPQAPLNSILAGIFEFDSITTMKGSAPMFSIIGSHEQHVNLTYANFTVTPV